MLLDRSDVNECTQACETVHSSASNIVGMLSVIYSRNNIISMYQCWTSVYGLEIEEFLKWSMHLKQWKA